MFDSRGGISCRDEFVRICDHPIKYGHYCSFCKQWIRNPNYVNATYYLNERHPAHETDCEYHNAGSASWETSARAGTDAIRTLADRAKVYSQTQKAAGAGRQASVRTQNQNSMSYQTTQRRSAVQQGKIRKRRGKWALCWWFCWFCLLCLELIICIVCLCILFIVILEMFEFYFHKQNAIVIFICNSCSNKHYSWLYFDSKNTGYIAASYATMVSYYIYAGLALYVYE